MANKVVVAKFGDSLCTIAIAHGFTDCTELRRLAENHRLLDRVLGPADQVTVPPIATKSVSAATEKKHTFKALATGPRLRFVHGSQLLSYDQDVTLSNLAVSNFVPDKAGADGMQPWPRGFGFNVHANADPDAFKVEVVDPAATANTVFICLRALKPLYKGAKVDKLEPFGDGEPQSNLRVIKRVPCQLADAKRRIFRSRYLRLATDEEDLKSLAGAAPLSESAQGLFVSDTTDGNNGDADRVEILDQNVQAEYVLKTCKAADPYKCVLPCRVGIGDDHRKVATSVHILLDAASQPVVSLKDARLRILCYVRRIYAQADMTLQFTSAAIGKVPLPANMFAVANANGQRAVGNAEIRVRVRVEQGSVSKEHEIAITTVRSQKPIHTATALADSIRTAFPPGMCKVTATENPPLVGQAIGSADVVVGDPLTQTISLTVLQSDDTNHPVVVGQLSTTTVVEFGGPDGHVGTIEERVLVKNYDSGADRIDLFVVGTLSDGSCGEAFIPNAAQPVSRRASAQMVNSALVWADVLSMPDHYHTTVAHEMGHILMDHGHAVPTTELMTQGSPVGSNETVLDGPKRISDPMVISYDDGTSGVPVQLLRGSNPGVFVK